MPRKKPSAEANARRVTNQKEKRHKISEGANKVIKIVKQVKKVIEKKSKDKIKEKTSEVIDEVRASAKAQYDKTKKVPQLAVGTYVMKLRSKIKE